MSRIGKQPIVLPPGVTAARAADCITVRGPKGAVVVPVHPQVTVTEADGLLTVTVVRPDAKFDRALWGLTGRLLANAVTGVTVGFVKHLEVFGVGYRVAMKGQALELSLGYSHPVVFPLPDGITATVEKQIITIAGVDRQRVGETAAKLHALRKPDAYHGKGVRYVGVTLKLKPGKAVTKSAS